MKVFAIISLIFASIMTILCLLVAGQQIDKGETGNNKAVLLLFVINAFILGTLIAILAGGYLNV